MFKILLLLFIISSTVNAFASETKVCKINGWIIPDVGNQCETFIKALENRPKIVNKCKGVYVIGMIGMSISNVYTKNCQDSYKNLERNWELKQKLLSN